MNKLNDFEVDLILKELTAYLTQKDIRNIHNTSNLLQSCLSYKYFESTKLCLKEPSAEVYENRLGYLVKSAKFYIKELTISGVWDNNWISYLTQFKRLNTLTLQDLTIDASLLNNLKITNLCLINVKLTNIQSFNLKVNSLQIIGNELSILEYLTKDSFNQVILTNGSSSSNQAFVSDGIVISLNNKKCLTLPILNQLKKLQNQQITTLKISNINLEITKLCELLSVWPLALTTLSITKSLLFPPSRITDQTLTTQKLANISLNEVDFRGFNYLEYLIRQNNLHLNLKDSELDKFNVIGFDYKLIMV